MYYQPIDPLTTGLNIASILMLAVSCLYIYVTNKNLEDLFAYYFPPTTTNTTTNTSENENTDTQTFYPTFPPTPEHLQQRLKEHQNAHHNTTMD